MAEYELYCFAQSGNAYRAALMLNLIGADWQPIWLDFFAGATRKPEYRDQINEMGEVPVLVHGSKKLTQSGVILTYLANHTGKFKPQGEDEELESLRWIIFDNQKVFDDFVNSGWEFGGQASAAAKTSPEKGGSMQGAASVSEGVWMYQLTDKGLALEITAKGTKYSKDDDLN